MNRFLPKSLFGQTILILLFGLVVSHAIGAWIYAGAREQAIAAGHTEVSLPDIGVAGDFGNVTRNLGKASEERRQVGDDFAFERDELFPEPSFKVGDRREDGGIGWRLWPVRFCAQRGANAGENAFAGGVHC